MQSVSSRIWTRVAVSISYDYNYYTTGIILENCNNFIEHWGVSSVNINNHLSLKLLYYILSN